MSLEAVNRRKWPAEATALIESDTEEAIEARALVVEKVAAAMADVIVKERLAATGGAPKSLAGTSSDTAGKISQEQLAGMTPAEIAEAYKAGRLAHLMGA
jgi:hypothetical protein